jgi:hypothetical protein
MNRITNPVKENENLLTTFVIFRLGFAVPCGRTPRKFLPDGEIPEMRDLADWDLKPARYERQNRIFSTVVPACGIRISFKNACKSGASEWNRTTDLGLMSPTL